jgi:hypothetical protein
MNIHMVNELKERLSQIIPMYSVNFTKLYEELLSFFSESETDYIINRHKELQKEGYKNKEIYSIISKEVSNHLFKGKKLSDRQLKRIIYKE